MAGLHQGIDRLVDVSDKNHGSTGTDRISATRKRARGHIVLHDLNTVFILKRNTRHFIKRNDIPNTNQTNLKATHIVEEICYGRLPTRNQDTVGTDLFVNMTFPGSARPKLAKIEVILHKGNHPR